MKSDLERFKRLTLRIPSQIFRFFGLNKIYFCNNKKKKNFIPKKLEKTVAFKHKHRIENEKVSSLVMSDEENKMKEIMLLLLLLVESNEFKIEIFFFPKR